jgi:hypothetical protein
VTKPERCLRRIAVLAAVVLAAAASACGSKSPAAPSPPPQEPATVAIMAPVRLSAAQLANWFTNRQPGPALAYMATVPPETLAQYFIEEGEAEGVTGDVALAQSVLETGWFRFAGAVPGWKNNFAGIGAIDSNPGEAAAFPDARTGVRAQIQHLRAYADPLAYACSVPPLHNGCVDPRFELVLPKGKAPMWNQLGNGNWATSPTYGTDVLRLYSDALAFNGLR